jgi:hypothetical protein
MTAILAIRVNDGIVLAAEGRSLIRRNRDGETVAAFDHAAKVFPLSASPSVGFVSCGAGSVGGLSMRFLASEVGEALRVKSVTTLRDAIGQSAEIIQRRSDQPIQAAHNPRPDFTWFVGGYDNSSPLPSLWRFSVKHGRPQAPERIEPALVWAGEGSNAIDRLMGGVAPEIPGIIRSEVSDGPSAERIVQLLGRLQLDLLHPETPLGDAVALAKLLLDTAIGIERLRGAIPSAGGQICLAIIDRQRGFRYVSGEPI